MARACSPSPTEHDGRAALGHPRRPSISPSLQSLRRLQRQGVRLWPATWALGMCPCLAPHRLQCPLPPPTPRATRQAKHQGQAASRPREVTASAAVLRGVAKAAAVGAVPVAGADSPAPFAVAAAGRSRPPRMAWAPAVVPLLPGAAARRSRPRRPCPNRHANCSESLPPCVSEWRRPSGALPVPPQGHRHWHDFAVLPMPRVWLAVAAAFRASCRCRGRAGVSWGGEVFRASVEMALRSCAPLPLLQLPDDAACVAVTGGGGPELEPRPLVANGQPQRMYLY